MKLHPMAASAVELVVLAVLFFFLWPLSWFQVFAVIAAITVCRITFDAAQNYKRDTTRPSL
jgi:hypothetical protein